MKCPIDQTDLVMTDRQGIEIDYCPNCRGVWLDRGELDKLIERTTAEFPAQERTASGRNDDRPHREPHRRKKKSMLGELFEF